MHSQQNLVSQYILPNGGLRPDGRIWNSTTEFISITDEGLRHMTVLKGLEKVNLWRAKVTDAGIQQLTALKKLRRLHLAGTDITSYAISKLHVSMPNCEITR